MNKSEIAEALRQSEYQLFQLMERLESLPFEEREMAVFYNVKDALTSIKEARKDWGVR